MSIRTRKQTVSFTLSREARALLKVMAIEFKLSRSAVVEQALLAWSVQRVPIGVKK